jgi:ferredoxin
MCELCAKHGAGGKWYLNAAHYGDEVVAKYGLRDYLMEQYTNFEQIPVRKVNGFNPVGFDYRLRIPIIGRVLRRIAENMLHSTRPPKNPFRAEGHIGQVVPVEDAVAILECCAAEPIVQKNCMCRFMSRGIEEACCINFGVMSEVLSRLPRFVPDNDKFFLTRKEAVERFTAFNKKGYIGTIWFGPFPYINNLCSCATPECAGIRPRLDFGIKSIYKAEYLANVRAEQCTGCGACAGACRFGALRVDAAAKTAIVDYDKCYGCGTCRHVCGRGALFLTSREPFTGIREKY